MLKKYQKQNIEIFIISCSSSCFGVTNMMVAAYCRVSTDRFDQQNSFESQCSYFTQFVNNHNDWQLYKVYADEGISGTATEKRNQFKEMIRDAVSNCFALIITKEVSRFSRNILDTIFYTRELKKHGVRVLFLNDGIDTGDADAELRLSIMGSIAQEESRKTSSRVKWGQQRRMEQGVVFGRSLLGYDVRNGHIYVNPKQAEIVREIFERYAIKKQSSKEISENLTAMGYNMSPSRIIKILHNEKYVGDLIQKKTYTPDYLSHKKKYNHGQEDLVIIKNHHDALISRQLWELTQIEINKRAKRKKVSGYSRKHVFSGKLNCGLCGKVLIARQKELKNGKILYWACPEKSCQLHRRIRNDHVEYMLDQCINSIDCEEIIDHSSERLILLLDEFSLFQDKAYVKLKYLPHQWEFKT